MSEKDKTGMARAGIPAAIDESPPGRRGGWLTPLRVLLAVCVLTAAFLITAYYTFDIKEVEISGCTLYTEDQVKRVVLVGDGSMQSLRGNAFYLPLLYRNRKITNVPFIDTISVRMKDTSSVEIQVTEKKYHAYVRANGTNYYIDDKGIVVQASDKVLPDTPRITRMQVTSAKVGEPLETERTFAVEQALEALRMLEKYDLSASSIRSEENGGVSFKINKIRFYLGEDGYDYKVEKIRQLMPSLEGRKGSIDLRNYEPDGRDIILQP